MFLDQLKKSEIVNILKGLFPSTAEQALTLAKKIEKEIKGGQVKRRKG